MYDLITYNNVSFSDFHTYWDSSKIFGTPEKQVEYYEVIGRSGDLSISKDRYKNKTISIDCFIRSDFVRNYTNLLNFLLSTNGYNRLETTKEPDIFRMAQFVSEVEPNTGAFLKYGNFTLQFNCKPQKWLKSGELPVEITDSITLINNYMEAKPLIEVVGTGSIIINDSALALDTNTSTTFIDCDIQDAYEGTINRNGNLTITNNFPVLKSGENTISMTGFDSVKLYPRWWRL